MTAADQGLAWRDEKRWLWATREAWGSDACADVGSLASWRGSFRFRCACVLTRAMRPVALMSGK